MTGEERVARVKAAAERLRVEQERALKQAGWKKVDDGWGWVHPTRGRQTFAGAVHRALVALGAEHCMGFEGNCPRPVEVRAGKATWCVDCSTKTSERFRPALASEAALPASVKARIRDYDDPRRTDL